jgi:hypothetical protein
MWDHYKNTFLRMQLVMFMAACVPVLATRSLTVGLVFLIPMQVGSLLGALVAAHMRKRNRLPGGSMRSKGVEG